jgi:hypothetical protein
LITDAPQKVGEEGVAQKGRASEIGADQGQIAWKRQEKGSQIAIEGGIKERQ